MRVGVENRKELALMACLLVGALVFVWHSFGTNPEPDKANVAAQPLASSNGKSAHDAKLFNSLDPSLRLDLLKTSESTEYKGSGRNIFRAEPDPPPIPKPVAPPLVTVEKPP